MDFTILEVIQNVRFAIILVKHAMVHHLWIVYPVIQVPLFKDHSIQVNACAQQKNFMMTVQIWHVLLVTLVAIDVEINIKICLL
jgi:hypothetical protein